MSPASFDSKEIDISEFQKMGESIIIIMNMKKMYRYLVSVYNFVLIQI